MDAVTPPARAPDQLAFTAGLAGILYLTVGKGIVDDVKNDTERQGGGGPQEERIVNKRNFGPIVKALRKEVGSEAELVTVTMRPTSAEFVVRDGSGAKGYRAEPGGDELEDVGVNLSGSGAVEESAWSIGKLDAAAPGRIAKAISRKESGDFNLTIATFERETSGKLLWDMKDRRRTGGLLHRAPGWVEGQDVRPDQPRGLRRAEGRAGHRRVHPQGRQRRGQDPGLHEGAGRPVVGGRAASAKESAPPRAGAARARRRAGAAARSRGWRPARPLAPRGPPR